MSNEELSTQLFNQSVAMRREGRYEEAIKLQKQSITVYPEDPEIASNFYSMGKIYYMMKEYEKSLIAYKVYNNLCVEKNPSIIRDYNAMLRYGDNLAQQKLLSSFRNLAHNVGHCVLDKDFQVKYSKEIMWYRYLLMGKKPEQYMNNADKIGKDYEKYDESCMEKGFSVIFGWFGELENITDIKAKTMDIANKTFSLNLGETQNIRGIEGNDSWTCVCGKVNTSQFCLNCGKSKSEQSVDFVQESLSVGSQSESISMQSNVIGNESSSNANKNHTTMFLLLIILVLSVAVGYLMMNKNEKSEVSIIKSVPSSSVEVTSNRNREPEMRNVTDEQNSTSTSLPRKDTDQDIAIPFIVKKNEYDQQIRSLVADVNSHIEINPNYRNARHLIERAERLSIDIRNTCNNLQQISFNDDSFKNQIIRVLEAEFIRVDGIREGMQSSYDGGDWHEGFKRGSKGKKQFDESNALLIKMVR